MKLLSFLVALLVFCQCRSDIKVKTFNEVTSQEDVEKKGKIIWHWEDEFTQADQQKIKTWLNKITDFTMTTLGGYQFNLHYYLHLSDGDEPVPFGHTSRKQQQSVHFYINPSFSLDEFVNDWTAQHEISHLSIPFIGKENMWFSEGYATYLSRKIMITQGIYTEKSFDSLYIERIGGDDVIYNTPHTSVVDLCRQLKQNHHYSSIYYAGSSYFFLTDKALRADRNMELIQVVQIYQNQNRLSDTTLSQVIASFDQISESKIFSKLFTDFNKKESVEVLSFFRQ